MQIHQVQNCRLSGCQSYASSSWKKKPKKRSAKKQHSLKARMRLYLFGLLRLDEWFSIRASDFLGILDIWKKGESNSLSCQAQLLPLAYSTGIWLSFSWLHKPWCPMYDTETTHYSTCNIATLLHGKWLGSFTLMKLVVSWGAWWWFFVDTWYLKRNPPITPGCNKHNGV